MRPRPYRTLALLLLLLTGLTAGADTGHGTRVAAAQGSSSTLNAQGTTSHSNSTSSNEHSETTESDTIVEENYNLVKQSAKTDNNDIINANSETVAGGKAINNDPVVSDKQNEEPTVTSNKDKANTNKGISNESSNENSRISKKSSTLTEVVTNKLTSDGAVNTSAVAAVDGAVDAVTVTGTCPLSCACSGGVQLGAQCTLREGAGLTVTREGGKYTVECQSASNAAMMQMFMPDDEGTDNVTDLYKQITTTPHISCSDLPSLSRWLGASETDGVTLVVRGCDVRISCLVETLGVKVISLMVQDAEEWRLQEDDVAGMQQLQELGLYYHEHPSVAFPSPLPPRLRTLTISGASLSLLPPPPPTPPPHHPHPLTRLELSNCRLSNLTNGVFKQFPMLEKLYLQNNRLTEIPGGVFEGLSNLLELGISSNELRSVPARELATHCPRLTVLSAFDNSLTTVEDIRLLKELTELELFYNRTPLPLPQGWLSHMPRLRTIDLRDSGVTSWPRDVIAHSDALRTLLLQGNRIQRLHEGTFMQQQELETLDVSNNNLTKLHPDVFSGLTALKELRLDGNNITELLDGVTSGLHSLHTLSMRDANLRVLHVNALRGCSALGTLILRGNQLLTVWMDAHMIMDQIGLVLNGLRHLEVIDLSHNNLTAVPSDVTSLLSLKRLDLSSNLIGHVDDLNYLSESVTVDLSHNRIQSLSLVAADVLDRDSDSIQSRVLLDDNPFVCNCLFFNAVRRMHGYTHPHLDKVTLEFGNATCSAPALLAGRLVTSLQQEDVYCDVTREDYCNDDVTTCLPQHCSIAYRQYTESLDIHCLHMPDTLPDINGWPVTGIRLTLDTPLPLTEWGYLTGVKLLNLSATGLRVVPLGMPPSTVRVIDLSRNNITSIPTELLNDNVTLHLSSNPLRCDCGSHSRVSHTQRQRHLVADYSTVTCSGAGGEVPLRAVNAEQLCSAQTAAAIGGALAAVGLIAGVLALILIRYRVECEIMLHKVGLMRRRDETDDGMTYDAFVSYAHEDEPFVMQQLLPKLEAGEGMKLCIHSRDWMPGEWISTSIAASVSHSRRTIIILSNHFLHSRWGRLEFQAALTDRGSHHRTRLILILLEDVSQHPDLDDELKAYLRTNTYLKWGDTWFWKKLIHAMPHHDKHQQQLPVRSICDVITHRQVLDRVADDGEHPADVIMAAAAAEAKRRDGNDNKGFDDKHHHFNDKLKQSQSLNVTDDIKRHDKLNHLTAPSRDTRIGALNDRLNDSLNNKLTAVEATLDALEQLHDARGGKRRGLSDGAIC